MTLVLQHYIYNDIMNNNDRYHQYSVCTEFDITATGRRTGVATKICSILSDETEITNKMRHFGIAHKSCLNLSDYITNKRGAVSSTATIS